MSKISQRIKWIPEVNQTTNYELRTTSPKQQKVALVCDWLVGGGAEKVVYELHLIYPEAPIYTSYCNDYWRNQLEPAKVITGYLQRWPFSVMRKYIPLLRTWWFNRLEFHDFDVIISASGAEAKGIHTPKGVKHVSYIHAPTHYYWARFNEYLKEPGFGKFSWLARRSLKKLIHPLRTLDFQAAQRPDVLLANSTHTREQIQKYYKRESKVVHPPIRTQKFNKYALDKAEREGLIVVGRQTPYKRIDLAVKACSELNLKLTVVGDGPEHERLCKIAGPTVEFINHIEDDSRLAELVGSATGFIFPTNIEDFGIAPVEALAAGTPVIAYSAGGPLDYIKPGKNGEFFDKQTVKSLKETLEKFNPDNYSVNEIKRSAEPFSIESFRKKITKLINSL
ncbi:glycosyltransferase [Candidatus Parcubacteria bacterium]|nr:glycosyltransferase [Candidatus Parcubacteria bacterium]